MKTRNERQRSENESGVTVAGTNHVTYVLDKCDKLEFFVEILMAQKEQIIKYLCSISDIGSIFTTKIDNSNFKIENVKQDWEAKEGDISWISQKILKKYPERINTFNGSLLICPTGIDQKYLKVSNLIICDKPKLAFIKVLNQFFSYLTDTKWPISGEKPIVDGTIIGINVRLSYGVVIGSNVIIANDVFIGPNTVIANCTLEKNVSIGANCSIGFPGFGYDKDERGIYWRFPHIGRVMIEEGVEIGSNTCIDRGAIGNTIIRKYARIDNLVHIAHNVEIGQNCMIIANAMIGGSAKINKDTWVAPSVSVMNQIQIADAALLGMGAVVIRDVPPNSIVVGNPAKLINKGHKDE